MSLLLTGATALFAKIFVHRNKEQNWLSAVPVKSCVFEDLKDNERLSQFPTAFYFLLGLYCDPSSPTPPFHYILPPP